jgi:diaminopimelate epimerase
VHPDAGAPFLEKWHGAGNDFLVVVRPSGAARLDAATAIRWCDRRTGLGADGVLEGTFGTKGLTLHLRNADGSEAELSGNGLRCLAAAVVRRGLLPEGTFDVQTDGGTRRVTVALDPSGERAWGSVEMGEVEVDPAGSLATGIAAVLGNPHVVVADDGCRDDELVGSARRIAADAPAGANVEFLTVDAPDHLTIRVVERGVGLTLACGTGSCAAAAVAHHLGLAGEQVTVANPGGDLGVALQGKSATLSGPAVRVASIELEGDW